MANTHDETWKERIAAQLRTKHPEISEVNLNKLIILEQKKAKAERQAKLILKNEREKERKARTRRLIELGGLIVKAGLEELDRETILGLLISAKYKTGDKEEIKKWKSLGAESFSQETK